MELSRIEIVYFLGIGGIGMSALARYFHAQGKTVLGYDRTPTALTTELEMEGLSIHYDDNVLEIPLIVRHAPKESVVVVWTPAIPADSPELNWFAHHDYTLLKRSAMLGAVTAQTHTLAIAGTHGKTTTSSLLAHLLTYSGVGCNAFLGGIASNYGSNLLLSSHSPFTVVEADEFDRSFLTLSPQALAITSMDPDHLDIYGDAASFHEGFRLFAGKLREGGMAVVKTGLPISQEHLPTGGRLLRYSVIEEADFMAHSIRVEEGRYVFDFKGPGISLQGLTLGLAGRHNVENAVAAMALALHAGVDPEVLPDALHTFRGVKRRFEYIVRDTSFTMIDDYAHHPEELRAAILSARELFPDKQITGVFQPHLFTRTRDFAEGFAEVLAELDRCYLLPIYPARELPLPGIDSQWLLDKIHTKSKKLLQKSELLAELRANRPEVLMMMGAGDIDALVQPMAEGLR